MQRKSIFSLILISLLLEWSLPAPLFPQSAFSTSKKSVERNFNKAAVAEGIKLSPEAIDSLRKYDLRLIQDSGLATAKSEVSPELTEGFTKAVISHLNQQKTVKKSDMDTAIVQAKIDEIHKMLPQEINSKALKSGITLTAEAQELIKADMEVQTKRMAVSGLSQQEIEKRNEDYLAAILAKAPKPDVGGEEYHIMKNAIFCKLVHRSLISIATRTFCGIIEKPSERSQSCHLQEREVI
jgi:hypothetical protein